MKYAILSTFLLFQCAIAAQVNVTSVTNGASLVSGPIAPGELIRISGTGFATAPALSAGSVPLPGTLTGVSASIDGTMLGLVSVTPTLIVAVAPAALQAGSHQLVVTSGSDSSAGFPVTGAAVAPAFFSADGSGQGQALAFNSDGTPNSSSNPAIPGGNVTIYFTGGGQTNPPFTDVALPGSIVNFAAIIIPGLVASDPYAGLVSLGLVQNRAGYDQVTVRLPLDIAPGAVPLTLDLYTISGDWSAPSGVTIAVGKSPLPLLSVQPSSLNFSSSGAGPPAQTISVSSSGAPIAFTLYAEASWLSASAGSGTTPANIVVTANPAGLTPNDYTGSLAFYYPAGAVYVNVTLSITAKPPPMPSIITTVAGADFTFPNQPLPAVQAPTGPISGVATDHNGNLYASDSGNHLVLKTDANGTLSIFAGNGIAGFSGDGGPATSASLAAPAGLAVDNSGNVFIVDSGRIRQVSPSGTITTVPGLTLVPDSSPAIAVDLNGNLYAGTTSGIQKRTPAGAVTLIPGSSDLSINAIAVDATGNIYITSGPINSASGPIAGLLYELTTDGTLVTITQSLDSPKGLRVDSAGNVDIAEPGMIVQVSSGVVTTIAGNGRQPLAGDNGPALNAAMGPVDLALNDSGDIFIADNYNNRVRRLRNGVITTAVGNGAFQSGGDGGPASSASFQRPSSVAVDLAGNLYIADTGNNRIRRVAPDGTITTVAGIGVADFRGDGGPATAASLQSPLGVAIDSGGSVYIADTGNERIRKVTPDGMISTIAGNGSSTITGPFGDGGPATSAPLTGPSAVAVDSSGNIFITEAYRIREVTPDGNITTIAGTGPGSCPPTPFLPTAPCGGDAGDGGPATKALLNGPKGIALDSQGNIVFADSGNGVVREVSNKGVIDTIVQTEVAVFDPHTPSIIRDMPLGVAVDATGTVYYSDVFDASQNLLTNPNRGAAKVASLSPSGAFTTLVGGGAEGFSGDGGLAASASLNYPGGIAVDSSGNLYIADTGNNRIRVVPGQPPAFADPSGGGTVVLSGLSGGAPVTRNLTISATFGYTVVIGMPFSVQVTGGAWLTASPASGATTGLLTLTADPFTLDPGTHTATVMVSMPNANPASRSITIQMNVGSAVAPNLAVDHNSLSFTYSSTSTPRTQTVTVLNGGGGSLPFRASVTPNPGQTAAWLSVTPGSATAAPGAPAALSVRADPSNLASGTYTASISISSGSGSSTVAVVMTISTNPLIMLLSQTGLTFIAVKDGGAVPPQTFSVLNLGSGALGWIAQTSVLGGVHNWLTATPTSGASNALSAGTSPAVTVSVDPSGLPPAVYYGLVTVTATGAANTPQGVVVILQVLKAGADVAPVVQPTSLTFAGSAGDSSPGSQNIQVYDPTGTNKSYRSGVVTTDGGNWLATLPADATIPASGPAQVVVQPIVDNLAPGTYQGTLTLRFSDGRVGTVQVQFVVTGAATGPAASANRARRKDSSGPCTSTQLMPSLLTLGPAFSVPAGYPQGLEARVVDNCGAPQVDGTVFVSFNNGDAPVKLQSLGNGTWDGTWPVGSKPTAVTLTVSAQNGAMVQGQNQIDGGSSEGLPSPMVAGNGVVNSAGFTPGMPGAPGVPVAPGELVTIVGQQLSGGVSSAPVGMGTLPPALSGTQALIGSQTGSAGGEYQAMPLLYASGGQVNAMVPFGTSVNTNQQILLQWGTAYAPPVYVDVAAASPGIFQSMGHVGLIYDAGGNAIGPANPAHAGDTVVIYCSGLGAVDPGVSDGAAAPGDVSVQNPVMVTVGGQKADVQMAGLTPGSTGLYMLTVVVPPGVAPGDSVPVTVTVSVQTSAPAFMSVR